jgi:N-acetylmuramoyl-L-alanine amidase
MKRGALLVSAVVVALISGLVAATEWKVVRVNDRDYVTFGNVAEFYHFPEYTHANRTISLRSERRGIRAQAGTSDLYINGVRFLTLYPLAIQVNESLISAVDVGKLIEPVLRPSRLANGRKIETVILDPGHGGTDEGAPSRWGSEKNFTLDVAKTAREQLLRAGFKVEMTRTTDVGLSLEERAEFANRFTNAVFVSIHFNSGTGGAGVESYALAPDGVPSTSGGGEHHSTANDGQPNLGNAQDGHNLALTAAIHAAVLSRVATYDRGVRHARFKVLRNLEIPAMLLEAGFLNDPAEGQRIATAQYRQQLATAIAQGVQSYDSAVNYQSENNGFTIVRANLPPHSRSIIEPLHANGAPEPVPHQEPSISVSAGESR